MTVSGEFRLLTNIEMPMRDGVTLAIFLRLF